MTLPEARNEWQKQGGLERLNEVYGIIETTEEPMPTSINYHGQILLGYLYKALETPAGLRHKVANYNVAVPLRQRYNKVRDLEYKRHERQFQPGTAPAHELSRIRILIRKAEEGDFHYVVLSTNSGLDEVLETIDESTGQPIAIEDVVKTLAEHQIPVAAAQNGYQDGEMPDFAAKALIYAAQNAEAREAVRRELEKSRQEKYDPHTDKSIDLFAPLKK